MQEGTSVGKEQEEEEGGTPVHSAGEEQEEGKEQNGVRGWGG